MRQHPIGSRRFTLRSRAWLVPLLSLGLGACGGGPTAQDYALVDGTHIHVGADGSMGITRHGATLLRTDGPIEASSYGEVVRGTAGFYRFIREGEVRQAVDQFVGSEQTAEGVTLHFRGDGAAEATVKVSVDRAEVATRVELSITGVPELEATSLGLGCDADASFLGFTRGRAASASGWRRGRPRSRRECG